MEALFFETSGITTATRCNTPQDIRQTERSLMVKPYEQWTYFNILKIGVAGSSETKRPPDYTVSPPPPGCCHYNACTALCACVSYEETAGHEGSVVMDIRMGNTLATQITSQVQHANKINDGTSGYCRRYSFRLHRRVARGEGRTPGLSINTKTSYSEVHALPLFSTVRLTTCYLHLRTR
jgi:hypothetical protein